MSPCRSPAPRVSHRRRKAKTTVTRWSSTSRAWGSCCFSWPVSWNCGGAAGQGQSLCLGLIPLPSAAEPAGRRRELLHAEVGASRGAAACRRGHGSEGAFLSLHQIQTLMARAEYLKDQMKVQLRQGGLWSVPRWGVAGWKRSSPLADAGGAVHGQGGTGRARPEQ